MMLLIILRICSRYIIITAAWYSQLLLLSEGSGVAVMDRCLYPCYSRPCLRADMTTAYAWREAVVAALQGDVPSQSSAQMAGNYYYNPSSIIGSKEPGKKTRLSRFALRCSFSGNTETFLTWALSLFSIVLNCTSITKTKTGKKGRLSTSTGSWPRCTNRNKWRSESSCTVLKVSIKMK